MLSSCCNHLPFQEFFVKQMTIRQLANDYYTSMEYDSLRVESQKHYKYFLDKMLSTKIEQQRFSKLNASELTTRMATLAYDLWCKKGVTMANYILSVSRVIFNHALRLEYITNNPFSEVKKRTTKSRSVVWTQEDVHNFLDQAYSDFQTRNIGLIAHMAYEWCQRLGDMRLLTWDAIDFDNKRVHIKQSKRRAEVFLPVSDDLLSMLQEQEEDFGFQKYVAPRPYALRGEYRPYSLQKLPMFARRIMKDAGLSDHLRLSDLRRTGTTEMVESGVGIAQIMSVTGHANPQSVKPYIKNTFDSANLALTQRKKRAISTLDAEQKEYI